MKQNNEILEINDDTIFIADSHAQGNRDSLISKLNNLPKIPSQIFLVGDISNILVGGIKRSVEYNKNIIDLLQYLSSKTQLIYLEGNHDFNLNNILPNIKKIPRKNQPIIAKYNNLNVLISHGDIFLNQQYEIYIRIITAESTIKFLNFINSLSKNKIYDFIHKKVEAKKIIFPNNKESIIKERITKYQKYIKSNNLEINIIIEGHFHIGEINKNKDFAYIGLPSFYYNGSAFNIKNMKFTIL